jgi:hypothetical protein
MTRGRLLQPAASRNFIDLPSFPVALSYFLCVKIWLAGSGITYALFPAGPPAQNAQAPRPRDASASASAAGHGMTEKIPGISHHLRPHAQ